MPIKSCSLPDGKSGYKWGDAGKCYRSKRDAIKQGLAIEGPDKFKKEVSALELLEAYLKNEDDQR